MKETKGLQHEYVERIDPRCDTGRRMTFYESWHIALAGLDNERYGRILRAMFEFQFNCEETKFENDEDKRLWELISLSMKLG